MKRQLSEIRTDWTALLVSIAFQIPVVVWAIGHWGAAMIALGPFEFMRLLLLRSVAAAYREYGDPWRAVKTFVKRAGTVLGLFIGLLLFYGITTFGLHKVVEVLTERSVWVSVLIPVGAMCGENALSLFFFRGDVRVQAARFDAMAEDATCWFVLVTLVIPGLIVAAFGLGIYVTKGTHLYMPEWVEAVLTVVAISYPAAYFAGKAIVLAQVYTARFALTGHRVLEGYGLLFVTSTKGQRYSQTERIENYAAEWRRAGMLGREVPTELDEWGRG